MTAIADFRAAVEAHDHAALVATLAPDVVFSSPAVHTPYEGRDATAFVLAGVVRVFEDFRYTDELVVPGPPVRATLRFRTRVGDREIEGVDLIRLDADGLVDELTVMIRPLKGLQALVAAMGAELEKLKAGGGA